MTYVLNMWKTYGLTSWMTKGTWSFKASPEKHKDDQRGTRNPYRCMNVMKEDAMDDKIIERYKTCEK